MIEQTSQVLMVMLPNSTLEKLQMTQEKILLELERMKSSSSNVDEYLTAVEFMERVKISRATFDEKRANNEFKVIKKNRKLYVPFAEIKRYMEGK